MKVRRGQVMVALGALFFGWGLTGVVGCAQEEEAPPGEDATGDGGSDVVAEIVEDVSLDVALDTTDAGPEVAPDVPPEPPFGWSEGSLGDLGVIGSMVALSPHEAYATSGNRVLRYNGSSWSAFGEPSDEVVHGVAAWGGDVIAVGDNGLIARRAAGSTTWEIEDGEVDVTLFAVTARDGGELIAVGDGSTILHYTPEDGWSSSHSGGSVSLRAVWSDPSSDGISGTLAVGSKGTLFRHAGDTWVTQQIAAGDVTLSAVLGMGERRFAVGSGGTISVKANETAPWQGATSNLTDGWDLHALAGLGEDDVRAFGDHGSIVAYDGDKWSVEHVTGPHHVISDLVAAGAAWDEDAEESTWMALTEAGGGLARSGDDWLDISTRPDGGIRALAGTTRDNLWACGPGGLLMVSSEQGWTTVDSGTHADLNDIVLTETGVVYVAGASATLLEISEAGEVSHLDLPAATDLLSVGAHGTTLVLGGKGGTVLQGDTETHTFSFWNTGMAWDVNAVTVDSAGAWWFAGGFGSLRRSEDGETTEVVSAPISGTLHDLVPWGDGVIVVGDNGAILEATAEGATLATAEKPATFLYGVHASASAVWAVGYPGAALQGVDGEWTETDTDSKVWLEAVWSDEEGAIAGGRSGTLLQWSEVP